MYCQWKVSPLAQLRFSRFYLIVYAAGQRDLISKWGMLKIFRGSVKGCGITFKDLRLRAHPRIPIVGGLLNLASWDGISKFLLLAIPEW